MKKTILVISAALMIAAGVFAWNQVSSSEEKQEYLLEEVESIVVNTNEWDVNIRKTNSREIKISAENLNHADDAKAKLIDGVLTIEQGEAKSDLFGGFSFKDNSKLEIELPTDYAKKTQINTESGDVTLSEMKLDNFSVKSITGDIYLSQVTANKSAKIKTAKGDIELSFETEPTNLRINTSAKAIDSESATSEYGKGEHRLDLACPQGTLSRY